MKEYRKDDEQKKSAVDEIRLKMDTKRNLKMSDKGPADKVQKKMMNEKKHRGKVSGLIAISGANLAKQLISVALCMQIQLTTLTLIRNYMIELPQENYKQAVPSCIAAVMIATMVTCFILKWCDGVIDNTATFRVGAFITLCALPAILSFAQNDGCEQPPPSLLLLSLGIMISMTGISVETEQSVIMSAAIGPAFTLLLLYGIWVGITVRYVMWTVLLSMTTAVIMHDRLKAVSLGHDSRLTDLAPLLMLFIAINMLMYLMGWLVATD